MGCAVEKLDDGREIDIHMFDSKIAAIKYLVNERYRYDRHEPWAFTSGLDFYDGPPRSHHKASVREKSGYWQVAIWKSTRYDG